MKLVQLFARITNKTQGTKSNNIFVRKQLNFKKKIFVLSIKCFFAQARILSLDGGQNSFSSIQLKNFSLGLESGLLTAIEVILKHWIYLTSHVKAGLLKGVIVFLT